MVWGLFLIMLGVVFTLAKLDVIDLHHWGTWWPTLMMAFGMAQIIAPGRPRQISSGLSFVLMGLWFLACIQHWYGLSFRTGWPLLVVVAGLEIVLRALLERHGPEWKGEEERHA
jgi:hypothetical protein